MMYHCIAIDLCSSSDAEFLENITNAELYQLVHHREKDAKKSHRGDDHPGGRHHIFAARPGHLLHLHANVVQKFAGIRNRAANFFAHAGGRSGDGVALRFFVLHFDRLHNLAPRSLTRTRKNLRRVPARPQRLNSGRGGGIRTPIPGFGDRSPDRWTTPLNSKPACPSPLRKRKPTSLPCAPCVCGTNYRTSSSPAAPCASSCFSSSCSCGSCTPRTAT